MGKIIRRDLTGIAFYLISFCFLFVFIIEARGQAPGTWSGTSSMLDARHDYTATLLPDGKVLIAGGAFLSHPNLGYPNSGMLYNPLNGTFTYTGSMGGRAGHTATLLLNGKVLITGGHNLTGLISRASLYDPSTGTFSGTGSLGTKRAGHTATLLPNGKVLILGGYNSTDGYLSSAEIYDPATGLFSPTGSRGTARRYHTATLLTNGRVLIAGGFNGSYLASAEVYDCANGIYGYAGNMGTARTDNTATLLPPNEGLLFY